MVEAAEDMSCKIVEGTSMGLNVTTLVTPAGTIHIHDGKFLTEGSAFLLNIGHLNMVEMNVPNKGNFFREELAKKGAGLEYQIYGQAGLDYGLEWFHAKIENVSPTYNRPRGKKVFMASPVETAEVSPSLLSVTQTASPVVGAATEELALDWVGEPLEPTLAYQWYIADTVNATYAAIDGATGASYTPVAKDEGKFLKVQVTASGTATGQVMSNAKKVQPAV
jgi:hypothetical protein